MEKRRIFSSPTDFGVFTVFEGGRKIGMDRQVEVHILIASGSKHGLSQLVDGDMVLWPIKSFITVPWKHLNPSVLTAQK